MSETNNTPAKIETIADAVLVKVKNYEQLGQIVLPKDYNAGNALKAAHLVLQGMETKTGKPVLETCTVNSISNTLFNMVTQGLSVAKGQCAFIVRGGNQLTLMREYNGTTAMAKRDCGLKHVNGQALYKGDIIDYEMDLKTAKMTLAEYKPKFENIKKENIIGAFAVAVFNDGTTDFDIMTMEEIRQSWLQGAAKGNSDAHVNFPQRMAEKTVINRLLTRYVSSATDEEYASRPVETQTEQQVNDGGVDVIDVNQEFQEAEIIVDVEQTPNHTDLPNRAQAGGNQEQSKQSEPGF